MDRSRPNTNPYGNPWIRADGLTAFPGWPTSPRIEALRAAWLDAGDLDEQRRICTELQMQLWQDVPLHPDGRILAVHRLSQGSARCAARLLRGLLWGSPSLELSTYLTRDEPRRLNVLLPPSKESRSKL
jgi:hypothetical protein